MTNEKECRYVLLVEDDEDLRMQMAGVLEDEGYWVETAENGKAALDFLIACEPEDLPGCIILDLMMPVMTGGELLNTLEKNYPELAKIPVLVATAKGSPKQELSGLSAHIGRIRKPMEIEEFLNSVLEHCGKPVARGKPATRSPSKK